MKRREFLKSTLLFAAISSVVGKATGILTDAFAATGASPVEMKHLGYKNVSPHLKAPVKKICSTCKYYKANKEAGDSAGQCTLPAMLNLVKKANPGITAVYVKDEGYCNMWLKKA